MEALVATHFGQHRHVLAPTRIPHLPPCGSHDVRIQVIYSELNPVDLQKLNRPKEGQAVPNPPFIPGYGGSGIIQEVGNEVTKDELQMGQRVAFLGDPNRNFGSYASQVVVNHRCVAIIPSNIDFRDAATVPLAGCTAYEALVKLGLGPPCPIDASIAMPKSQMTNSSSSTRSSSLLVVGGAGGVGSWATRLARVWHPNLHIIATVSSPMSQEWCLQENGANEVIRHDEIQSKLTGGREGSVDFILCLSEPVPLLFRALAEVIRPYGTICLVVANSSIQSMDLGFCFFKAVTVTTETVFTSIRSNFVRFQPDQEISELMALLSSHRIKAPISPQLVKLNEDWTCALHENGLLDTLASGHTTGKLVMKITLDQQET